ncbi:UNVERIFIED_CONTAM: hypothetical protein RKD50_007570 [Streptomyces canus]
MGQQVVADVFLEEEQVVLAGHLVADHGDPDPELPCVVAVLAVDRDALAGGFGHQEGEVEAGEQARGEGIRAGRHVDDDVLTGTVDQVVEVQLHPAQLGVVAGDAQVALLELARHHQRNVTHPPDVSGVQFVLAQQSKQT